MKKYLYLALVCALLTLCLFAFSSCTDLFSFASDGLEFKTLQTDVIKMKGTVSYATETFNFTEEITVNSGSFYTVALDKDGKNVCESKNVPLEVGDNTFYVIETKEKKVVNIYEICIYRKDAFTVYFDADNGTPTLEQKVEEGALAKEPDAPIKLGCIFDGWDVDLTNPINSDTVVTAKYKTAPEMEMFEFTSSESECTIVKVKDKESSEITIPDYVTYIGEMAFASCDKITSVSIPDSVKAISWHAFTGCTSLESVTFGGGIEKIEGFAFDGCTGLKSVVLPKGLTKIEYGMFFGCDGLEWVVIPSSVVEIADKAFLFSFHWLEAVYYGGTEEEWQNVVIGEENYINENYYFYSEEEPQEEGQYWHFDEDGEVAVW